MWSFFFSKHKEISPTELSFSLIFHFALPLLAKSRTASDYCTFELCFRSRKTKKRVSIDRSNMLVFVYGALLRELDAQDAEAVRVRGFSVEMRNKGPTVLLEPAFLTLLRSATSTAHGAICHMSAERWQRMIAHELSYKVSVLNGDESEHVIIEVVDRNDNVVRVVNEPVHGLVACAERNRLLEEEVPCSARYAALLVEGAEHVGLPEHVVERYREFRRRGPTLSLWLNRMLFNGTLLPLLRALVKLVGFVPALLLVLVCYGACIIYAISFLARLF
jgi:hypothetical protein